MNILAFLLCLASVSQSSIASPSGTTLVKRFDFSWKVESNPAPAVPSWTLYFKSLPNSGSFGEDIKRCSAGANVWGASFDDGPSDSTQVVLDYFDKVKMKTTFWVTGISVVKYADILIAAHKAGHDIGFHTYSHSDLAALSDDQVISELVYGAKAVADVIGVYPKYFRPPYGSINDRVRGLAKSMGLSAVTWAFDSNDWSYTGTGQMNKVPALFKSWMDQGMNNAISLQHDYGAETVSIVGESLDILIKAGKTLVPLRDCLGVSTVYGNSVLEEFFKSGHFENKNVPPPAVASTTTAPSTTTTTTATTAATVAPTTISASSRTTTATVPTTVAAPSTTLGTTSTTVSISTGTTSPGPGLSGVLNGIDDSIAKGIANVDAVTTTKQPNTSDSTPSILHRKSLIGVVVFMIVARHLT
ncbi:hypothetical protein BDR26DRAFT_849237 [Obelidium mucronatum]|nr:hypothetical protein BDR26DRAFT_849237 [Obelidium mucronatum]